LWQELLSLNIQSSPRLLAGDFNTARFTDEKVGGKALSFQQLGPINDFITSCSLSDLRSVGSPWSWNNKSLDSGRIAVRLDRALCNTQWLATLPMSYYEYLPHSTGDHSPMQIHLIKRAGSGFIPFKFFNFWQTAEGFNSVPKETWMLHVEGTH